MRIASLDLPVLLAWCLLCPLPSFSFSSSLPAGATGRRTHRGPPLKWALAGRDARKLESVKAALQLDATIAEPPAIIIADADSQQSLQRMTAQTRVVISTVGPFAKYGEPLIASCVKTGTDYVDTTGETLWTSDMIAKYDEQAVRNGVIVSNMCGFDSIPADLSAFLVASELRSKFQTDTRHLQGFITVNGMGVSGGTIASMINMLSLPKSELKRAANPYLLNPAGTEPAKWRRVESDQSLPRFDSIINRWTSPWLMARINTRVVRRTIALRRQLDKSGRGFGDEVSYSECTPTPSFIVAFIKWAVSLVAVLLLVLKPTRVLLQRYVLPAPGEGPSAATRAKTTFAHRTIGTGENGARVQAVISGGDPGYTDTAKMVAETALTLAEDRARIELTKLQSTTGTNGLVGGFYTPAIVGGEILAERLRGAGLGVVVEEFKGE